MGLHCLISEEEVAAAIKGLNIGKSAGPTGVVSEMMKAAGGFGSRWMTDLINNIVAPNDTAYKRWSCHSGLKRLCKLCRTSPPGFFGMPAMRTRWMAGAVAHKSG